MKDDEDYSDLQAISALLWRSDYVAAMIEKYQKTNEKEIKQITENQYDYVCLPTSNQNNDQKYIKQILLVEN